MLNLILPLILILIPILPAFAVEFTPQTSPEPTRLWDNHQMILDGTVTDVEVQEDKTQYIIQVNNYFKSPYKFDTVLAYGDISMQENDRAFFFLYDNGKNYQISEFSLKITKDCTLRNKLLLLAVPSSSLEMNQHFSQIINKNSCLPEHYSLIDDEVIAPSQYTLTPLKQIQKGVSITQITCLDSLELVLKYDGVTPACVKLDTKQKLLDRGWLEL